VFVNAMRIY